jgi:hypothetical protein
LARGVRRETGEERTKKKETYVPNKYELKDVVRQINSGRDVSDRYTIYDARLVSLALKKVKK